MKAHLVTAAIVSSGFAIFAILLLARVEPEVVRPDKWTGEMDKERMRVHLCVDHNLGCGE